MAMICDEETGLTKFYPDETSEEENERETGFFSKLMSWFRRHEATPYVKTRDFNNQGNDEIREEHNESKSGVEAGIRISF